MPGRLHAGCFKVIFFIIITMMLACSRWSECVRNDIKWQSPLSSHQWFKAASLWSRWIWKQSWQWYVQSDKRWRTSSHWASSLLNVKAANPGDDVADGGLHEHDGGKPAKGGHEIHHPLKICVTHSPAGDCNKFPWFFLVRFPNPLAFGSGLGERTPKKAIF